MQLRSVVVAAVVAAAVAQSLFFVSPSGDDSADGTSPTTPWQTLSHAASALVGASSIQLLLQCGEVFPTTAPVNFTRVSDFVIASYGCQTGDMERPAIVRTGADNTRAGPVLAFNDSSLHVELVGVEVAGGEQGVSFFWSQPGTYGGFHVADSYFHNIRGLNPVPNAAEWWGAAITFAAKYAGVEVWNVTITSCLFNDSDTAYANQLTSVPATTRAFVHSLMFANNTLTHISFNTVFLDTTDAVTVANNVFMDNQPVSLFTAGTTDIIMGTLNSSSAIVANEISRRGEYTPGGPDGCAIDLETNANGVLVADNYISKSWGAGIMLLGHSAPNTNIQINNNRFLWDGCNQTMADHSAIFVSHLNTTATVAYNTFVTCPGVPLFNPGQPGALDGITLVNNIVANATNPIKVAADPEVALSSVQAAGYLNVTASCSDPGCMLRFTVDGSRPTILSGVWPSFGWYQSLGRTTAINVKAFLPNGIESATRGGIFSPVTTG